jgi:hypothetical protein
MHKGFKCLDVAGGHVYISRDIVFYETVHPLSKLNPNGGARLRSKILLLPAHSQPIHSLPTHKVKILDSSSADVHITHVPANATCSHEFPAENSGETGANCSKYGVVHSRSIDGTRANVDLPQTEPPTLGGSGTDPEVDSILDPTNHTSGTKPGEDSAHPHAMRMRGALLTSPRAFARVPH